MPVSNSDNYAAALKAAGVPYEYVRGEIGGHGFGLRLSNGHSVEGWQDVLWAWGVKRRHFAA